MRFIQCQQGTPEWLQARAGIITASRFEEALSVLSRKSGEKVAGDPTDGSDKYAADVAIERISGVPYGAPVKAWTLERGHELEAQARLLYEQRYGDIVEEAGICLTDDGVFGYSTDGLVEPAHEGDRIISCTGLIEIKCPVDSLKITAMWATGDTSEYDHQMQGGMWITGAKWCDLLMYAPDLANAGRDLFVKRVYRDEEFINKLELGLLAFQQRVQSIEAKLRAPANEPFLRVA